MRECLPITSFSLRRVLDTPLQEARGSRVQEGQGFSREHSLNGHLRALQAGNTDGRTWRGSPGSPWVSWKSQDSTGDLEQGCETGNQKEGREEKRKA